MESAVRVQNKSILRDLVKKEFRKDFSYAERVVARLNKKGVTVSKQMVYQTVAGNSYNAHIAYTVAVLIRGYRIYNKSLNRVLNSLVVS